MIVGFLFLGVVLGTLSAITMTVMGATLGMILLAYMLGGTLGLLGGVAVAMCRSTRTGAMGHEMGQIA